MEFNFSVKARSETWTPKGKSEVKPKKLKSYQKYYGNRGSSFKSGCGFYIIKEGIRFKPRKDLDIAYHDADNEFQSTWLKSLMVTNQALLLVFTTGTSPQKSKNIFWENLRQHCI